MSAPVRDGALALIGVGLFAVAALIAISAWLARASNPPDRPGYWDVAGALTLIGIGVAALVDPCERTLRKVSCRLWIGAQPRRGGGLNWQWHHA
jgi:hypothetical protein